jgi:D-erythro-7,8-dihydroneopterin triphosphate epimerase
MKIATIHIKNLRLRTFIGFNEEELIKKQDVVINIYLDYDASKAMQSDSVDDACNYKVLTKKIINVVEANRFNLLEKMSADIMSIIQTDKAILKAKVEIDKPHALRFSDSVSISYVWKV